MSRPVCFITGTTHGIGKVTAEVIASREFTVVMGCRDLLKGRAVREAISERTGNRNVHVLHCDLASLASVRACAAAFVSDFESLDLLINNAGLMTTRLQHSTDGIELSFATNYLGPYLLTRLLMDPLRRANEARIVNVASTIHTSGNMDLESVAGSADTQRFSGMRAYARSKLGNVMFTLSLAERLAATNVTANCLHPGVVATNIAAGTNAFLRVGMKLAAPFMFNDTRGAKTSLYLALDPAVAGISGRYYNEKQRPVPPADAALDPDAREKLWRWSEAACNLEDLPFDEAVAT